MNGLRKIWGDRFTHYMIEVQNYMKFIFTGHLAIVLMFTIGAGGYAYSEWLKEVPATFPSVLLTALVLAFALTMSTPVTLLKEADGIYLLPLETKLPSYMKKALQWTTFSQLPIPILLFIVGVPLLSATVGMNFAFITVMLVAIIMLKWLFVRIEYAMRFAFEKEKVFFDRSIRFVIASVLLGSLLSSQFWLLVVSVIFLLLYYRQSTRWMHGKPFPFVHFIQLEQNRMLRFYRFANLFTDVPHLKGSVRRRAWLQFFYGKTDVSTGSAQLYLLKRTFIRTDDIFNLWVRLTVLSTAGAALISFPIVSFIFSGALAFAAALQLKLLLRGGDEFRMDLLFPNAVEMREEAIQSIVRRVQWIQAFFVGIASMYQHGLSINPILTFAVVLIISEATLRLAGDMKEIEE